nr:MAG TPA: hypothetical protein [Caudoviricetes sp.]
MAISQSPAGSLMVWLPDPASQAQQAGSSQLTLRKLIFRF